MNLTLDLHIPVVNYPQRGGKLKLSFELGYTSSVFNFTNSQIPCGNSDPTTCPWTGYRNQGAEGTIFLRPSFGVTLNPSILGTGISADFITSAVDGIHLALPTSTSSTWYTVDSSGWMLNTTDSRCPSSTPQSAVSPDGVINCGSWQTFLASNLPWAPNVMLDTNGNNIVNNGASLTDSVGRSIPLPPFQPNQWFGYPSTPVNPNLTGCQGPLSSFQDFLWNLPGVYGQNLPYNFCMANGYSYRLIICEDAGGNPTYLDTLTDNCANPNPNGPTPQTTGGGGLQSLVLPNNTAWIFQYDPVYGDLTSVTSPTGGTITYTWTNFVATATPTQNAEGPPTVFTRAIATRTVDANDGTGPHTWTYTQIPPQTGTALCPPYSVKVTNPDSTYNVHTFQPQAIVGSDCGYYESTTRYFTATGVLLKEQDNTYSSTPTNNSYFLDLNVSPVLISTTTTLGNGMISAEQKDYDPGVQVSGGFNVGFGNVIADRFYDYGNGVPGSLIAATNNTYVWENNAAYLNAGLLQLIASSCQATAGNTTCSTPSNSASYTSYGYDESGSPGGALGNQTSVHPWSGSANQMVITSTKYNSNGMPVQTTDANNNYTSYTYDGTGAFVSKVQQPSTNEVPHVDYYSYDSTTGLLLSHTDQNGSAAGDPAHTTSYSYDIMNRPTGVSYPDGGSQTAQYNDVTPPTALFTTATGEPSGPMVKNVIYDGAGRTQQVQTTSDPDGTDYVDTTYDSLGRVASVSNPYRSKSDVTYGITSYAYDALGRKTVQTQPDYSTLKWCYDGVSNAGWSNCPSNQSSVSSATWVNSMDEVGNISQQVYDGLGHLKAVMEQAPSSSSLAFETDYNYDVIGNLLSVNQHGNGTTDTTRTRGFTYDSLSRLLTSSNPETGTICYGVWSGSSCVNGYDANGNLLNKTDARGVTINYAYDSLNRLTAKTYSNSSLLSCYGYDTATNGIGMLGTEWTTTNSCSTISGYQTMRQSLTYDSMGRLWNELQCVLGHCTSGPTPPCATNINNAPYYLTYCYDLAGNMTWSVNGVSTVPGVSSISFTQLFDSVNRLSSLTSSWNDSTHPPNLFNATSTIGYSPAGALQTYTTGNHISVAKSYDNQLRTTAETAAQQ
jgi:YD repeat-containing protein